MQIERNEYFLSEMVKFYKGTSMPDPSQYPARFKFMTLVFEHHLLAKKAKSEVVLYEK